MSTVERDLAQYERIQASQDAYYRELGTATDDLLDKIERKHPEFIQLRDDALEAMEQHDKFREAIGAIAFATGNERRDLSDTINRIAYDELSGLCREYAARNRGKWQEWRDEELALRDDGRKAA
ncbi:MAG: hypothetical protein VX796_05985 [Pseudomonadota bacterium]|nr:hypothetical protein [Pseudomonadota bacterium]